MDPFVVLVGGKHGSYEGIANHVPDGVHIIHVATLDEAVRAARDLDNPVTRDYGSATLTAFGLELRLFDHELVLGNKIRPLSRIQFFLAWEFMARPRQWLTTGHLLAEVWQDPERKDSRALRQAIAGLRSTLRDIEARACIEADIARYRLVEVQTGDCCGGL